LESAGAVSPVIAVPTGHQQYKMTYPGEKRSAAQAREDIRLILLTWALPSLCDTAELVATELLANAVEHAKASDVKMSIARLGKWVEISVFDPGSGRPTMHSASPDDEGGRGVMMIDALCSAWGWENSTPTTKRVWARLAL